jgi:hypothetical protein
VSASVLAVVWLAFDERIASRFFGNYSLVVSLALFIAGVPYSMSRCPRCGNFFFWRAWASNPFAEKCMNCSLSLGGD